MVVADTADLVVADIEDWDMTAVDIVAADMAAFYLG
jgi:hypothetical protein